jgi:hypothetical protein
MSQWIKAGGAAALVIAGIPVLIGSRLVGAVLIVLGLVLGLALWLQESDGVPFRIVRKDRAAAVATTQPDHTDPEPAHQYKTSGLATET